ncbi:hypothetical protein [Clostridium acidisoli]|nr:hypothetical protein [Clostridium acidisoli]
MPHWQDGRINGNAVNGERICLQQKGYDDFSSLCCEKSLNLKSII